MPKEPHIASKRSLYSPQKRPTNAFAALSVGKAPLKEAHVLLWASHVQTLFLTVDRLESELLPMMLLALCRAGASFDLGCPAIPDAHTYQ